MGAYYYLAAQLPSIIFGQPPFMSSYAFKNLAASQMSKSEAEVLEQCTLAFEADNKKTKSELVNRYKEWERTLRLNLARGRAVKLSREGPAEVPDFPPSAVAAAKAALAMDSSFDAEMALIKARWEAIESFEGFNIFTEEAMYAYLLKLLLMERRMAFNEEKGFQAYKALYTAILGEAK